MKKLIIFLIFCSSLITINAQKLNLHPVPQGLIYSLHNDDFTVKVRIPGEEWQDLFEYKVTVDLDNPQVASMVQFDFEGKVEMMVKVNNGFVHNVKIRPTNKNIEYTKKNNIIYFTLDKPSKLSLEVNDDRLKNLHIFANEVEKEIPSANDTDVIYFGEGIHTPKDLPGNVFRVSSNQTVYLAPGAVIKGKFVCNKAENIRFIGRGIILEPERGFELTYCKNIEIDGITVINPNHYTVYGGEVTGLKINNLKSFSCKSWSDGIDLMSCSDVTINDIFMRNSDDCITIYTHRWTYNGDARNYKVTNAILWADIAHPINIGGHGDYKKGYIVENVHFSDIHILEHDEDDRNYQGCLAINAADNNLVQNISFENVWIDDIQEGQLFNIRVLFNEKYSDGPGKSIKDVRFKNIHYTGYGENPSIIEGFNDKCNVENISWENFTINGKRVETFEDANIKVGKYTQNIILK
ncbi:glycoside hydrolase [Dysgonomonas sp. 216]|uniref:glycosyl hydrolase family 28 protein n=1 Tax=Dysgonomonas sp. 216 TaxID=2302934 RepID=UPI0013CFD7F4|nr:glycosyl hydrolase family 28 protein [Dysgonomonas sp. 216]NDW17749.1 glycoside hydrolase [Dysgonomonas sp. 216]